MLKKREDRSLSMPCSASVLPTMQRAATRASGVPVALATNGTVRDARGLTSSTKISSWRTANCTFIKTDDLECESHLAGLAGNLGNGFIRQRKRGQTAR